MCAVCAQVLYRIILWNMCQMIATLMEDLVKRADIVYILLIGRWRLPRRLLMNLCFFSPQAPKRGFKGGMKRKGKEKDDSHRHKKKQSVWFLHLDITYLSVWWTIMRNFVTTNLFINFGYSLIDFYYVVVVVVGGGGGGGGIVHCFTLNGLVNCKRNRMKHFKHLLWSVFSLKSKWVTPIIPLNGFLMFIGELTRVRSRL